MVMREGATELRRYLRCGRGHGGGHWRCGSGMMREGALTGREGGTVGGGKKGGLPGIFTDFCEFLRVCP